MGLSDKSLSLKLRSNKEVKNAGWLIGGRIIQMVISLLVGVLTARYLGPSNYGLIGYGGAYIAFFSSLCNLGINSVLVKNFIDHPDEEGNTIGTTLLLRLISSGISCVIIFCITSIIDASEAETVAVVVLCSLSLVFHIFETFDFWFQSRYLAKRTAMATLCAYIITSLYRIILLILGKSVIWFAFVTSIDYIVYAIIIVFFYIKDGGPKLSVSRQKAKQLLSASCHFILSGVMVAIYGYTDKFMLKHMFDSTSVGYYTTAYTVCNLWVFVLQAIINSMYPTIMRLYKTDRQAYERKNRQLYAIVFYVSIAVSLVVTVFGRWAICILYGSEYIGAVAPLRIITWYVAFSYLGVARDAWIVCENQQKYLKYIYGCAASLNIICNLIFIPIWGASGAAFASLITQIFTSLILPCMFKGIRHNSKLMFEAILFKNVFRPKEKQ